MTIITNNVGENKISWDKKLKYPLWDDKIKERNKIEIYDLN